MLIKVTGFEDSKPCWINGDYVVLIRQVPDKSGAFIAMTNGSFFVSESMDEVVAMLAGEDDNDEKGM
jgi:uncharacterized protein YlzI (FlbEa/FlbD family)